MVYDANGDSIVDTVGAADTLAGRPYFGDDLAGYLATLYPGFVLRLCDTVEAMREMLAEHQWATSDPEEYAECAGPACPECGNTKEKGHAPSCALAALIKED